jgi:hypothetical protein
MLFLGQTEGNQYPLGIGIHRDYTPELISLGDPKPRSINVPFLFRRSFHNHSFNFSVPCFNPWYLRAFVLVPPFMLG